MGSSPMGRNLTAGPLYSGLRPFARWRTGSSPRFVLWLCILRGDRMMVLPSGRVAGAYLFGVPVRAQDGEVEDEELVVVGMLDVVVFSVKAVAAERIVMRHDHPRRGCRMSCTHQTDEVLRSAGPVQHGPLGLQSEPPRMGAEHEERAARVSPQVPRPHQLR